MQRSAARHHHISCWCRQPAAKSLRCSAVQLRGSKRSLVRRDTTSAKGGLGAPTHPCGW